MSAISPYSPKDPSLRVLTENPCTQVPGPETGNDREGPILCSDQLLALLVGRAVDEDGMDVPLYRRRTYAVAHHAMARRSELAALTAGSVDFAHETISISKQVDRKQKTATKKTKTRRTGTIDIEPNLLPLAVQLAKEARRAATVSNILKLERRKCVRGHFPVRPG